ncbi:TlyA family RNA methyltransferase [Agrococcus carbonis]|uniref:23S rRNA (Cytidine1920-2'-O)/16S rRNA (Cytidine1409-2'-O)-methyltransferase n=1 Tax=Agrococcus carbonis TaxID=684552 RepID=A0A1H1SNC4_9MICO|nr:TlyA family RNA methyltransferase [Agrococcus carbonis]SDS49500.1 23S rRNA (cytidine1920-2'-O)/16S rRNA (cytidine1409-2'-O)-methyltransferase [Agrococcus carbonis]
MAEQLRLDQALVERGLARSRTQAQQLIAAGLVRVDGRDVRKASAKVAVEAELDVAGGDPWVSRAAHKLLAALEAFDVDPAGRVALDAGASTGGFTQVLLARGAAHVTALDVGHDQFQLDVDAHPITLIEGQNVRDLEPGSLQPAPTVVVADLSFISLTLAIEPLAGVAAPGADWIVLIKPQFEVGRTGVRAGLVTDATLRAQAIEQVLWAAWDAGLGTAGLIGSPIAGTRGNLEYLAHLSAVRGANPTEWLGESVRLAREAR